MGPTTLENVLKSREEKLDEQLKSVHDHIERLEEAHIEVGELRRQEIEKLKGIEEKERRVDSARGLLEKRLKAVEEREREFESVHDRKSRELASREELLNRKNDVFVKLANEKLREGEKLRSDLIGKFGSALSVLEGMSVTINGKIKDIENWASVARESLSAKVKEADLIRESVEKRFEELEKREREFNSLQEEKKRELMLKEQELSRERRDLVEEFKLREEKLAEQHRLGQQRLESLEAMVSGRIKEVEAQVLSLNEARAAVAASAKEAKLCEESVNIRLREVEKKEKEFKLYQDKRMRELVLEEEKLSASAKEAKLCEESVNIRLREVEKKEKEFKLYQDKRMRELVLEEEKLSACAKEAKLCEESVNIRLREVEKKEKEFKLYQDKRMRELVLEEEKLSASAKDAKLCKESVNIRLREVEKKEKEFKLYQDKRMRELVLEEEKLSASAKEAKLCKESVNIRLREVEKKEKEFKLYQDKRMRELVLEEEKLSSMREKLTEQHRLGLRRLEDLKAVFSGRFKEIDAQELSLNEARAAVAATAKEAELTSESANIRLSEVKKREEELNLYQEKRMRELVLEQEKLSLMRDQLIQEVMSREKKHDEQDKLVDELLERLELAYCNIKDVKLMVSKRFKETATYEIETNSIRSWVERNRNEVDSKEKELEEHDKIETKRKLLLSCTDKLESEEKQLIEHDLREKNLNSGRVFRLTCPNERPAIKSQLQQETDLVEKHVLPEENEPQMKSGPRESESKEKQVPFCLKELKLKEQQSESANVRIRPDEFMDLKHASKMERETLERLIRKNSELSVDEISEVLRLSSAPAKLVLDAMELFFSNNFKKGDMESNVRRNFISVLEQLAILSPIIQPCVRGEAIKLASDWKSKVKTTGEDSLEVLGFLLFLTAYKISSCLDKDELLSLLVTVAQCKQTLELYRVLGLSENMPGLIQKLIQTKQYLLASTFIHDYKLEHVFPQAGVLNYFIIQSKHLAKEKCKTENNSPEAQDKAIVEEIAALKTMIEHIVKYGLEYAYSLDTLRIKINQLEQERASLQKEPSSRSDQEKQGQSNGSDQPRDANKRTEHDRPREETKKAATDFKAQLRKQVALERPSFFSGARPQQNNTRKRPASALANVHEPYERLEPTNKSHRLRISAEEERRRYPRSAASQRCGRNDVSASRSFSAKDRLSR